MKNVTEENKENYFLVDIDDENFYVKEGDEESYNVEEGVDDALVFTEEEALEVVLENPHRFKLVKVSDILTKEEIEIRE